MRRTEKELPACSMHGRAFRCAVPYDVMRSSRSPVCPAVGLVKSKVQEGLTQLRAATRPPEPQQQQATYAPPVLLQSTPQQQQPQCPQPQQPLKQPPPPHFIIQCKCHQISLIPDPNFGRFSHPGTLMGPGELDLLRQRAAGTVSTPEPFQAALASLKADTPAQYTPHALKDMLIEWYDGPKIGKRMQIQLT